MANKAIRQVASGGQNARHCGWFLDFPPFHFRYLSRILTVTVGMSAYDKLLNVMEISKPGDQAAATPFRDKTILLVGNVIAHFVV